MTVQTRSRGRVSSSSAELPATSAAAQHDDTANDATSGAGPITRSLRSSQKRTGEAEVESPPKRSRRLRGTGVEDGISVDEMIRLTSETMKEPLERAGRHRRESSRKQPTEQDGSEEAGEDESDDDDLFVKQSEPVGDEDGQESEPSNYSQDQEAAEDGESEEVEEAEEHHGTIAERESAELPPQRSTTASRRRRGRPPKTGKPQQAKSTGEANRTTRPQTRQQPRVGSETQARESSDGHDHTDNDQAARDLLDSEEEEEDEGLVHIDLPADAPSPRTTQMSGAHLKSMMWVMRRKQWADGSDWDVILIKHMETRSHDFHKLNSPPGQRLFQYLSTLYSLFRGMRRPTQLDLDGYNFAEQTYQLRSKSYERKELFKKIDQEVGAIHGISLGIRDAAARRPRKGALEERRNLFKDLCAYIIPSLIVNLKRVFMLGGVVKKSGRSGNITTFVEKGYFTRDALSILGRITTWLDCLEDILRKMEEARPTPQKSASTRSMASQEAPEETTAQLDKDKIVRDQLQVYIRGFDRDISLAHRRMAEAEEDETSRQLRLARDNAVRQAQEQMREKEEARRQRQFELAAASTQAFRDQPNPLHQQQQLSPVPVSRPWSSQNSPRNTRPRPLSSGRRQVSGRDGAFSPGRNKATVALAPSRPFREEELNILLNELRNTRVPNLTVIANKLDRARQEVVEHAEALKRMFREIVHERRLGAPPKWAIS